MKPLRDPEGAELKQLLSACPLSRSRVLEIGCGNGTLTHQYADLPSLLVGIDPAADDLREAADRQPALSARVHFSRAVAEALPFPAAAFDVVLFASSF